MPRALVISSFIWTILYLVVELLRFLVVIWKSPITSSSAASFHLPWLQGLLFRYRPCPAVLFPTHWRAGYVAGYSLPNSLKGRLCGFCKPHLLLFQLSVQWFNPNLNSNCRLISSSLRAIPSFLISFRSWVCDLSRSYQKEACDFC